MPRRPVPADFNPRSPHGERLDGRNRAAVLVISIHAPRTGSDPGVRPAWAVLRGFQSTLPARGATFVCYVPRLSATISIHAPRTGSDFCNADVRKSQCDFNPRSPHGERQHSSPRTLHGQNFNPRSPHGERLRKVTILSIRIIDFAQKVYHKTVLLRISLAENAVILPEKPRNPVRTSLQKAGGLRFARAIRAAHPYSISSPSGA